MTDDEPVEPAEPAEPDEPAPPAGPDRLQLDRPRAVAASPAAQVATVAAALTVIAVVVIVFALQGPKGRPEVAPVPSGATTVVPSPPPTGQLPASQDTALLPPVPSVPASLCPDLTVKHPLTVLSFNTHGSLGRGRRLEIGRVGAEIKAWKPDVVLLQEIDDHRRRTAGLTEAKELGRLTGLSWVYGPNQQRPDGGPIGNAILTRHKVESWENIPLPLAGGAEHRGLLHAVIDVKGVKISLYATHFDHRSGVARNAQAHAVVEVLAKDKRPKILGGDLNSPPGSGPVRTLHDGGLGDAWAVGEGAGFTEPANNPHARIDYILHDGWFSPIQAAVLYSTVSDHRAVWARLEVREEIGCIKVGG